MKLNYIITSDLITISFEGKNTSIERDSSLGREVLTLIVEDRLDLIPELIESNTFLGNGIELTDEGRLLVEGVPMPLELSSRILEFKKNKLPYKPLIKLAENIAKNPSFNSREMLFKFLEKNNHPITKDGTFIAYKGVTSEYKDCHTNSIDNSIGQVVRMDRNLVDDNPNNTCSTGLHVASFSYARDFGRRLIEVEVNPVNVVAVPSDYDGTKMRVCEYKVIGECEQEIDDLIYEEEA